jgi:hypothetical protein
MIYPLKLKLKPPFIGDFPLPRLITGGYMTVTKQGTGLAKSSFHFICRNSGWERDTLEVSQPCEFDPYNISNICIPIYPTITQYIPCHIFSVCRLTCTHSIQSNVSRSNFKFSRNKLTKSKSMD